ANENAHSGLQTVATFTDPGGAEVAALSGSVALSTGAGGTSPIKINSLSTGLATGDFVTITGDSFITNGTYMVTVVDPSHFTLNGTTGIVGSGSGGTWTCNTKFSLVGDYTATINWEVQPRA